MGKAFLDELWPLVALAPVLRLETLVLPNSLRGEVCVEEGGEYV